MLHKLTENERRSSAPSWAYICECEDMFASMELLKAHARLANLEDLAKLAKFVIGKLPQYPAEASDEIELILELCKEVGIE